ncbi:MAG: Rne/Rng family ribonuclease [Proteobacteria bacterium]|nr:Rne/Rng family ribonuclease [Pseudomonadota bacterium]
MVNRTAGEVRVALVQEGRPSAFYVERDRDRGIVGNIYKGRVVRVVPGMQSAFVDVGLERAAFLYVGDIQLEDQAEAQAASPGGGAQMDVSPEVARDLGLLSSSPGGGRGEEPTIIEARSLAGGGNEVDLDWPVAANGAATPSGDPRDPETTLRPVPPAGTRTRKDKPRIEQVLRAGQELMVQVSKEPIGTKGARLTTQLAIPGRYLVYLPTSSHVGVSRRITDTPERERLRETVEALRRPQEGFIVRTVCEGRSEETLAADIEYLREVWVGVRSDVSRAKTPAALHTELDLVVRATRDLLSNKLDRLIVDDATDHQRLGRFIDRFMPGMAGKLSHYSDPVPLFEATGMERRLNQALGRKVRLPSGGYIVIDHTEALTAIDVNSGRFTGGKDLEETSRLVNLEAVKVVSEQLRLRDIGGLIIIDFIDMEDPAGRAAVEAAMAEAVAADPARASSLPISDFGLVEMTRRRVRENLASNLHADCETCGGRGHVKSVETVSYEILREVARNVGGAAGSVRELIVRCEPGVSEHLTRHERPALDRLGRELGAPLKITPEDHFGRERFAVSFQVRPGSANR